MTAASERRFVAPWLPTPVLRTVRHQVNNMLAPITVAAEVIDGEPETVKMLQRSANRLRRVNDRMALLVRPGDPELESVTASSLDPRCDLDVLVLVDIDRIRKRLIEELDRNGARVTFSLAAPGALPGLTGEHLVIESWLDDSALTTVELDNLAVPLTMRSGGLGLALACLETHLHGGRVTVGDGSQGIEFLLPVR